MKHQDKLMSEYLQYISNFNLKSGLKDFISFFKTIDEFKIELFYKDKINMHDIRICNKSEKLQKNFGRTKQPFSMVVYQDYFSFYIRGRNNMFRDDKLCKKFSNCHKNNSGELIFKLTNPQEIKSLLDYIFIDSLNIKRKIS